MPRDLNLFSDPRRKLLDRRRFKTPMV